MNSYVDGTVRFWLPDEGWGVIDSDSTPGGCWAHFSAITMDGYKALRDGQEVKLLSESFLQDGYPFRAVVVIPAG